MPIEVKGEQLLILNDCSFYLLILLFYGHSYPIKGIQYSPFVSLKVLLIYDITIDKANNDKSDISITMTLTTPGCSMGEHMAEDIKMKLKKNSKINSANVNITFDPPWNPSIMNDEAREKLGFGATNDNNVDDEKDWE